MIIVKAMSMKSKKIERTPTPPASLVIELLMEEVAAGAVKRDTMKNSSYEFSGETQAMYFSVLRNNIVNNRAADGSLGSV